MKVFSQSPKGYLEVWNWGFVALFVVGLLRFFMAPVGIPIETGGKLVSLTVVLLARWSAIRPISGGAAASSAM
jgi:hypothetical protein